MSSKASAKHQPLEDPAHDEASMSTVLDMVNSLHKYSKDNWTSKEEALWKKYLEMCRGGELVSLRLRGLDDEKAEKLIERVWVRRNPDSGALIVEHAPSNNASSCVPAIRVFRNGSFVIPSDVLYYLNRHPVLAVPGGDTPADGDDRPVILQAIEAVEDDLGLGYIGLGFVPLGIPEDAGRDKRIFDCGAAVHQLNVLLDTKYLKNTPDEDLMWLRVAKDRDRFWRLLDTAFLFGRFMEHHRILDELAAEEAMLRRITMPPGKGGRIERAVVRMIEAYVLENNLLPTPGKLLKWLGGEKSPLRGKPLQVDHPLWTADMKPISWERFQDLVKKAKQKMKR